MEKLNHRCTAAGINQILQIKCGTKSERSLINIFYLIKTFHTPAIIKYSEHKGKLKFSNPVIPVTKTAVAGFSNSHLVSSINWLISF